MQSLNGWPTSRREGSNVSSQKPQQGKRRPRGVQMTRKRRWRHQHPDAVIVDRSTPWGNPFKVGKPIPAPFTGYKGHSVVVDAALAVELFELYVRMSPGYIERVRAELAGRDLADWCPLDQPCHRDVLLAIANEPEVPSLLQHDTEEELAGHTEDTAREPEREVVPA